MLLSYLLPWRTWQICIASSFCFKLLLMLSHLQSPLLLFTG